MTSNNMHDSNNNPVTLWYKHPLSGWTEATKNLALQEAYALQVTDTLCDAPPTAAPAAPVRSDMTFSRLPGFEALMADHLYQAAGSPMPDSWCRKQVAAHNELPAASEAAEDIARVLRAEERSWVDVNLSECRVVEGFRLQRNRGNGWGGVIPMTPGALERLMGARLKGWYPGGLAAVMAMASRSPAEVIVDLNRGLRSGEYEPHARLLLRKIEGQRQVFAMHSGSYMPICPGEGFARVVRAIRQNGRLEDPRARVTYDQNSSRFQGVISYHADYQQIVREGVGSAYEGGIKVNTSCLADSYYNVGQPWIKRPVCDNQMVMTHTVNAPDTLIKHRCGENNIVAAQRLAMERIERATGPAVRFMQECAAAYGKDMAALQTVEVCAYDAVEKHLKAIRSALKYSSKALPEKVLMASLRATQQEDSDGPRAVTGADLVNTFTRAATHGAEGDLFDDLQRWARLEPLKALVPVVTARYAA